MTSYGDNFDSIIVGAGVLGLWAARHVIGEGRSVCILDRGRVGSGASGGILGALMSHAPTDWSAKKEFQFQALDTLENELTWLREDTGMDAGYRRCGRLTLLDGEEEMEKVEKWLRGSRENWRGRYSMEYVEAGKAGFFQHDWPCTRVASSGAIFDTLAARIGSRKLVKALGAFASSRGEVREGHTVKKIDPLRNEVILEDGSCLKGEEIIVANGVDAYRLLYPFMGEINNGAPIGRGVAGQAMALDYPHDDTLPILYQNGVYVVPHEGNHVAVGSTSRPVELADLGDETMEFDADDTTFFEKAGQWVPGLETSPVIEHWSGVRPRNTFNGSGADPWFAPVPGFNNLIALIGGFKITFGVAHRAMEAARCGSDLKA